MMRRVFSRFVTQVVRTRAIQWQMPLTSVIAHQIRYQHDTHDGFDSNEINSDNNYSEEGNIGDHDMKSSWQMEKNYLEDSSALQNELASTMDNEGVEGFTLESALARPLEKTDKRADSKIALEKIDRPPARFDLLTNSLVYRWQTTAEFARKISGPMREWATELKYRTGVHLEIEPTYPEKLLFSSSQGGYASADDVEITVYLFGSDRGIYNCHELMERILSEDPAYVRLAVFRRLPDNLKDSSSDSNNRENVEWLTLRRINRELRPPDIPPISLKTPGKWTLLFEQYEEAAIRTLWEETGITVERSSVYPTGRLHQTNPAFYWRVPVYYFIAEVPYDVEILGPQVALNSYVHGWDEKLLRQSPDPIDRAWATHGNPLTGCAWVKAPLLDELQRPLRGEDYMAIRYTPPPYSQLASVLGFETETEDVSKPESTSSIEENNASVEDTAAHTVQAKCDSDNICSGSDSKDVADENTSNAAESDDSDDSSDNNTQTKQNKLDDVSKEGTDTEKNEE